MFDSRTERYRSFLQPPTERDKKPRFQRVSGIPSRRRNFIKAQLCSTASKSTASQPQAASESISGADPCFGAENRSRACLVTEIGQSQPELLWRLWRDFRRHLEGGEIKEIISQRCRNKSTKESWGVLKVSGFWLNSRGRLSAVDCDARTWPFLRQGLSFWGERVDEGWRIAAVTLAGFPPVTLLSLCHHWDYQYKHFPRDSHQKH